LLSEAEDGERGTAVVEEAEVFTLEAGDEFTVFVDYGEDEIDFVDLDLEGGNGLVDLWAGRGSGLTGCRSLGRRSLGGSLRGSCGRLLSGGRSWGSGGWRRRGCRDGCRA
jgi:hypothetical protein